MFFGALAMLGSIFLFSEYNKNGSLIIGNPTLKAFKNKGHSDFLKCAGISGTVEYTMFRPVFNEEHNLKEQFEANENLKIIQVTLTKDNQKAIVQYKANTKTKRFEDLPIAFTLDGEAKSIISFGLFCM